MNITEFLLARIEEDEAWPTRAAEDEAQRVRADGMPDVTAADVLANWKELSEQGERFPWTRQLAECKAKRAIIEQADEASGLDMQVDGEFRVGSRDTKVEPYCGDVILNAMTAIYADHPDYQAEWE